MDYTVDSGGGTLASAGPGIAPRSRIFVTNTVHALLLSEFCSRI